MEQLDAAEWISTHSSSPVSNHDDQLLELLAEHSFVPNVRNASAPAAIVRRLPVDKLVEADVVLSE